MLKIDNSLLQEVGLGGLPAAEKNSFLKHIYETLEMRVGIRLADQMSNQQLDEFERYFEAKDDAGAFKWLETNFPNYKDIVQQEFDKLKKEVAQSAPQILAASQQNAQNPVQGQPQAAVSQGQSPQSHSQPQPAPAPVTPPAQPMNTPISDQADFATSSQNPSGPAVPPVPTSVNPTPATPPPAHPIQPVFPDSPQPQQPAPAPPQPPAQPMTPQQPPFPPQQPPAGPPQ